MKLYLPIQTISCDRTEYKKYLTVLAPTDLCLEVEIPDEEVRLENDGNYIITEYGLELLYNKVARIADNAHKKYIKDEYKKER